MGHHYRGHRPTPTGTSRNALVVERNASSQHLHTSTVAAATGVSDKIVRRLVDRRLALPLRALPLLLLQSTSLTTQPSSYCSSSWYTHTPASACIGPSAIATATTNTTTRLTPMVHLPLLYTTLLSIPLLHWRCHYGLCLVRLLEAQLQCKCKHSIIIHQF